eukprot:m.168223 g.168223  ORF g.168223 m.168223 type:complete len:944 (+) comp16648_c1_seq22:80-2911(+)
MDDLAAQTGPESLATAAKMAIAESSLSPEQAMWAQLELDRLIACLKEAHSSEKTLRVKAEGLHTDVQRQQTELARVDGSLLDQSTPAGVAQQELLKAGNELTLVSARITEAEEVLITLKEERANTEYEIELARSSLAERLPEAENLRQQEASIAEDTTRHRTALASLQEHQVDLQATVKTLAEAKTAQETALNRLAHECSQRSAEPTRIANQCGMMEVTVTRLKRVEREVTEQWQARKTELSQTSEDINQLEADLANGDASVAAAINARTRTERLLQQHELTLSRTKDAATDELGQRALLETQLHQLDKNLMAVQDTISQRTRTKEHKLKALKAAQMREQALKDSVAAEATQLALLSTTLQSKRKEAIDFSDILVKLQNEVASQQRSWETAHGTAQSAITTVQGMSSRGRSLDKELVHEARKLADLTRKTASLKRAVDRASAERLKSLSELQRQQQNLGTAMQSANEVKRSYKLLQRRIRDTARLHSIVKGERTACLAQINAVQQRTAELQDKARILNTEIEILKASAVEKSSKLQAAKTEASAQIGMLEQQRAETNALRRQHNEVLGTQKSSASMNQKQLEGIEVLERKLLKLREDHSSVIKQRNAHAKTLLDRQNELVLLYDRLNLQGETIHRGELELNERNQDIQLLSAERSELERAIGLLNKAVPKQRQLEQDLLNAQLDLAAVQRQVKELEETLQSPEQTDRWRVLPGKDVDPTDLEAKLAELANRLADKETQGLERDLVLAETLKLCDRTQAQLDTGRGRTLRAATSVREYQLKLEDLNRKLMAVVSELSMYQAKALQEQQQLEDLRENLATAQANMLAGKPPTDEAHREWNKQERRLKQESQARVASMHASETGAQLAGGERRSNKTICRDLRNFTLVCAATITQAPQRPTAYMPATEGALPIAKPYGSQAPFRPAGQPSHLRHLRSTVRASISSA